MDRKLIDRYWNRYGKKYLSRDITKLYPETKVIPQYIRGNFPEARIVLDLGIGTGPWFWASFLPSLVKLDGIDLNPEALAAADRVFQVKCVPEGFALIHRRLGRKFSEEDLKSLAGKRGDFFFFDYTKPWPRQIRRNHYDLITEHGGGFGEMKNLEEVSATVKHCSKALKPDGCLLFVNFEMNSHPGSRSFRLNEEVFRHAAQGAGMKMIDFQVAAPTRKERIASSVEKILYGYARKAKRTRLPR